MVVSILVVCNFTLFCAFLRLLRSLRSFAPFCALLRSFACFCVRPRLEPPQQCANWVHCTRRGSEKSTFLAIFWGFWFSQDRLLSRNSTGNPLNLIKSPIFANTACNPLVFTMYLVCTLLTTAFGNCRVYRPLVGAEGCNPLAVLLGEGVCKVLWDWRWRCHARKRSATVNWDWFKNPCP